MTFLPRFGCNLKTSIYWHSDYEGTNFGTHRVLSLKAGLSLDYHIRTDIIDLSTLSCALTDIIELATELSSAHPPHSYSCYTTKCSMSLLSNAEQTSGMRCVPEFVRGQCFSAIWCMYIHFITKYIQCYP